MDMKHYQTEAHKFAKYNEEDEIFYPVLGLCGESGEIADKIKKYYRDGTIDSGGLKKEIGDVLWYLAEIATVWGFDLGDCASENLKKLSDRLNRGVISGSGDNR